jgi:hypothetical protein
MSETLLFASEGSRITLGTASQLCLSEHSFTVLVWVKIVRHNIVHQGDNAILGSNNCEPNRCLHLVVRNGYPYFGFYTNDLGCNVFLQVETWYHLGFVYNLETKTQSIFVNGKLSATEAGHEPLGGNADVFISQYAGARGLNGK